MCFPFVSAVCSRGGKKRKEEWDMSSSVGDRERAAQEEEGGRSSSFQLRITSERGEWMKCERWSEKKKKKTLKGALVCLSLFRASFHSFYRDPRLVHSPTIEDRKKTRERREEPQDTEQCSSRWPLQLL